MSVWPVDSNWYTGGISRQLTVYKKFATEITLYRQLKTQQTLRLVCTDSCDIYSGWFTPFTAVPWPLSAADILQYVDRCYVADFPYTVNGHEAHSVYRFMSDGLGPKSAGFNQMKACH